MTQCMLMTNIIINCNESACIDIFMYNKSYRIGEFYRPVQRLELGVEMVKGIDTVCHNKEKEYS